MEDSKSAKKDISALLARIDDLRLLLDLEARCLSGHRMNVRRAITLQSLREHYPGSARRFRDELLMNETDHEALLIFALECEDRDNAGEFAQSKRPSVCNAALDNSQTTDRQSSLDDSNDDLSP